jgi:hypothetical protein
LRARWAPRRAVLDEHASEEREQFPGPEALDDDLAREIIELLVQRIEAMHRREQLRVGKRLHHVRVVLERRGAKRTKVPPGEREPGRENPLDILFDRGRSRRLGRLGRLG